MATRYVGWFSDPTVASVTAIAKSGANSVSLGPYCIMTKWNDAKLGWVNASVAQYTHVIKQARALGLKVILKPMVDCDSYRGDPVSIGFRAALNPSNIASWMQDYWTKCFQPYLSLVDVVAVHTELATISFLYPNSFLELIQEIRMAGFSGPITTSQDFDPLGCPYWTALDWIGGDAYPTIRPDTLTHAVADWSVVAQQAAVVHAQTGCNVAFGELCPNYGTTLTDTQTALVYEAFWEVFGPLDYWTGAVAWRWPQDSSTPGSARMAGLVRGLPATPAYASPQAHVSVGR
jgi:hypothetical protein